MNIQHTFLILKLVEDVLYEYHEIETYVQVSIISYLKIDFCYLLIYILVFSQDVNKY